MNHHGEISGDARRDVKDQSHDGEGHGASTFWGGTADGRADNHGDAHGVMRREVLEEVVLDGQAPPIDENLTIVFLGFH